MPETTPTENTPDITPDYVINDFLNGAGNHEIKLLVGSLLLTDSRQSHTAASIAAHFNAHLERTVHLTPTEINGFCKGSLALIGRIATAAQPEGWQAQPDYLAEKTALAGVLGDFSLRWPTVSLQPILGTSVSRGTIRSPETRYNIYDAIEEAGDERPLSIPDLLNQFNPDHHRSLKVQLTTLHNLNIIDKQSNRKGVDPMVQVRHTEYTHSVPLDKAIPETRALYTALAKLEAGATLSVNQLADLAKAVDESIDTAKLTTQLKYGLNGRSYPGLLQVDAKRLKNDGQSLLLLNESVAEPIVALVQGVRTVKNGENLDTLADVAKEIANEPELIRLLVEKGRAFSPYSGRSHGHVVRKHLCNLLDEHGALTVEQARTFLGERQGRTFSKQYVSDLLRDLVEKGQLTTTRSKQNPHSNVTSLVYRPTTARNSQE